MSTDEGNTMTSMAEELPRERASDVPEGTEVRGDGSTVTPVSALTDQQKAELLPQAQTEQDAALEAEQAASAEQAAAEREVASMDSVPREQGTNVDGAK